MAASALCRPTGGLSSSAFCPSADLLDSEHDAALLEAAMLDCICDSD